MNRKTLYIVAALFTIVTAPLVYTLASLTGEQAASQEVETILLGVACQYPKEMEVEIRAHFPTGVYGFTQDEIVNAIMSKCDKLP